MNIWIDMQAPPDVQFFRPFIDEFSKYGMVYVTARDYAETVGLLRAFGIEHWVIGSESSGNNIVKVFNTLKRTLELYKKNFFSFDVCFALGNLHSIYVSKLRKKPVINFMDNELGLKGTVDRRTIFDFGVVKSQILLADYIIVPAAFPVNALIADGMDRKRIFTFNGYKEDVYLADYKPNPTIFEEIPFDSFVVIRPESSAIYKENTPSLVPKLTERLIERGFNIVYLPRIPKDLELIQNVQASGKVFVPEQPLNGLDLCYYSQAVLSGSGTITREAACMGKKAVSFFPGKNLLAVDSFLIKEGKLLHSRNVDEIVDYLTSTDYKKPDLSRSKKVKKEVFSIVKGILVEKGIL